MRHRFVDALEELVAETRLPSIVALAGAQDVKGGQRRKSNRMRQR